MPQRKRTHKARIVSTPGIQGGQPCFEGTRLPAEVIWAQLTAGSPPEEILKGYPHMPTCGLAAVRKWARETGRL